MPSIVISVFRVKDPAGVAGKRASLDGPAGRKVMSIAQRTADPRRDVRAGPAGRPAVEVAHLRKTYRELVAVDDVSFAVAEGEIFGILGPNGAGKTTTVECAIGLRTPDAGTIRLLGLDPLTQPDEVHEIVGVQLQSGSLPDKLKVSEILD